MEIAEKTSKFIEQLFSYGCNDMQLVEIDDKTKIAQRIILCTAQNIVHTKQVAMAFKEWAKEFAQCYHTDGLIKGEWIVIDYKEIIVHIFTKETRKKYNVEKLWKDCKHIVNSNTKK